MIVNQTEYLSKLAEFNKNLTISAVSGDFFGGITLHFVNGKVGTYKIEQSIRQKDLEE